MEENSGPTGSLPENTKNNGEEKTSKSKWVLVNEVLDLKEAKEQVWFSVPMVLTNVFYYSIPLVSVMFAGHLGALELAGATLANSWITATGFAFMIGLSGALETLCGQAFGAGLFSVMGIHLQASCLTTLLFSIIISFFWLFTEPILVFLGQDPHISHTAAIYTKFMIPCLFAFGFLQNILRFLQTQSTVRPLVLFSALSLVVHIGVAYCLVHLTPLGFRGAPLGASIAMWISVLVLAVYLMFSGKFERTWLAFSSESFEYIFVNLKLALPSAAMVCLEYWAFEILVVLAGLMPNPESSTSLIAICMNTEAIAYMITYSLSAAASTRVSNELGAGRPVRAKSAMFVALKLTVIQAIAVVVALRIGRDTWVGFFGNGSEIRRSFASMTPLLSASIVLDAIQGILSGVARGCGWQRIAVCVNLVMFYFVGLTISCLLAFKLKLYHKGLWIGLICGLSCQAATLILITTRKKWTRLKLYM